MLNKLIAWVAANMKFDVSNPNVLNVLKTISEIQPSQLARNLRGRSFNHLHDSDVFAIIDGFFRGVKQTDEQRSFLRILLRKQSPSFTEFFRLENKTAILAFLNEQEEKECGRLVKDLSSELASLPDKQPLYISWKERGEDGNVNVRFLRTLRYKVAYSPLGMDDGELVLSTTFGELNNKPNHPRSEKPFTLRLDERDMDVKVRVLKS